MFFDGLIEIVKSEM